MVMDDNDLFAVYINIDHFAVYINIELLCCIPDTYIMLHVIYTSIEKKDMRRFQV